MKAVSTQQCAMSGRTLRVGDFLTIGNQWATVTVTHDPTDYGRGQPYVVTGDLKHTDVPDMPFPTLQAAVQYAFQSLAEYAKGRVA